MTDPIPPYDEQITTRVRVIATALATQNDRLLDADLAFATRQVEALVALATAAAYRHAAAYARECSRVVNDADPKREFGLDMPYEYLSRFFEAWAEKAE